MLPHSHIALTIVAFDLVGRRVPALRQADLRLVALAASGPDLVDKPLTALYFHPRFESVMLFGHTLLGQLAAVTLTIRRAPAWWPYAFAFLLHAVQDRLWVRDIFWWPLSGWRFRVWRKCGNEQRDSKRGYWYAFTQQPELWVWEVLGVLALAWLVVRHRLYRPERLWLVLRTGHLPE
jgi:hypothetical protein